MITIVFGGRSGGLADDYLTKDVRAVFKFSLTFGQILPLISIIIMISNLIINSSKFQK